MKIVGHFINGEMINNDTRSQDVFNPVIGKVTKRFALASK
ncbi:MAG: malonate-semialdehyde dehydrogenase (acetylating)/methylmalonate-semialdehyde dehydrogenase [Paraglaciecola sp.]|jgi:malonate-semialdehyde dehydrogenase (acetylating)/methylmalonate-semialdehyde dehydrogenase